MSPFIEDIVTHRQTPETWQPRPPIRPLERTLSLPKSAQRKIAVGNIQTNSAPLTALHISEEQLEPIAQSPHIRIHILLQLKSLRNNLHRPILNLSVLTGFEAEEEVASVLGVDAEIVD